MKILLRLATILIFMCFCAEAVSQEPEKKAPPFFISAAEVRFIAINNNLDIKLAQLDSKIKATELDYKQAVFDTILNGEIGYTDDQRKTASSAFGTKALTNDYNVGLDKKLMTGTDVSIDFTNKREWTNSQFVSINPYHASQVEISLTQPIAKNFFGLIDRGNIEIVKNEIKNAELDSYIKIEDAMLTAEKAYWKLALAIEEFSINKEMLKKAITLFNQYRRKLKIGLVETGDVLAAEANLHTRENNLRAASNGLETAMETLKLSLNIRNEARLFPVDPIRAQDMEADFIESLKTAFENRRDYKSKKNDILAKKIRLWMNRNSLFPEIDLKATFATNGIDAKYYKSVTDVYEDSNPEYYIGLKFTHPLENNEAKSEYEKAKLEKTKAIINLHKAERKIVSEVDESFRKLSLNKLNMSSMERVENLQKGKLLQEEKRFRYGRSNSDAIIRYQEDLLNASLRKQASYFDYRVSILELMASEDILLKYMGLE